MGDLIQLIKVVKIEPKFDKEGRISFEETVKMQRSEDMQNFEIDYDGDLNRRLVMRW